MPRNENPGAPGARPRSKIRVFRVSTPGAPTPWATIEQAEAVAIAHRDNDLGPSFATNVVRRQWLGLAAGIELGIATPPVAPPEDAVDEVFDDSYWNKPPT